jgi:CMP-N-acetylneuraminic acid synthetase
MSDMSAPILCVVPARGGSRGIPRKALQPVGTVPLILRTLQTVQQADVADRLVVSTEDKDIAAFCRLRGFEVLDRPAELAADDVTLAEVISHAVVTLDWQGTVLVAQATCPLLTSETVVSFVRQFHETNLDWAISGAPAGHIVWDTGICRTPRVNRQQLPSHIKQESGALQIMSSAFAREPSGRRGVIEIPAAEALDIDTHADLAAARQILGRKTIEFRVVASDEKGAGHLWRCLQLSDALSHHRVRWQLAGLDGWAVDIVRRHGVEMGNYGWADFGLWAEEADAPDLLIVDALEVAETVVPVAKAHGVPVVLFEHDGPACRFADLVVDEFADPKWTVLRPEFVALPPKLIEQNNLRVVVSFGGSDPAGLNQRVASMLGYALDAEVRVIQGPGAIPIEGPQFARRVKVVTGASMAEEFYNADLVVTSQGRTIAEAIACYTPVVSIAANERESRHARLPGVVYLGLHVQLSDQTLIDTVQRLLDRPLLRQEMVATAQAQVDGLGVERIVWQIEGMLRGLT